MIKKFLLSVLTLGTLINFVPSTSGYAYTYHTVSNYSQYLGQSVNSNGNREGWYKFDDGTWGYYIEYGKLIKDSQLNFSDGMYIIDEGGKTGTG